MLRPLESGGDSLGDAGTHTRNVTARDLEGELERLLGYPAVHSAAGKPRKMRVVRYVGKYVAMRLSTYDESRHEADPISCREF
nr:hypothetical protein CFP56_04649 [Quercus suber]